MKPQRRPTEIFSYPDYAVESLRGTSVFLMQHQGTLWRLRKIYWIQRRQREAFWDAERAIRKIFCACLERRADLSILSPREFFKSSENCYCSKRYSKIILLTSREVFEIKMHGRLVIFKECFCNPVQG